MVNDARWLTVHDVADVLQVKVETVRRWIRRGQLSALELGGPRTVYRIRPDDLDRFIWQRYHAPTEDQAHATTTNGNGHARSDGATTQAPPKQSKETIEADGYTDGQAQDTAEPEPRVLPGSDVDFRRLVEGLPTMSFIFRESPGEAGQITYISPQIEKLLGIPLSEWRSNPELWLELMHPEDRERLLALDDEARDRFTFEFRWLTRDRRVLWLTAEAMLVRDDDGTPLYWHGVLFDITEQRQVAEQLKARVRQHETLARLGRRALEEEDPQVLFDEVVRYATEALNVEHARLFELLPGGNDLVLRATVAWQDDRVGREELGSGAAGEVGETLVSAQNDTQSAYTLISDEPVIANDLRTEIRFNGPRMAERYGLTSGITVIIPGSGRPFGVLGAHSTGGHTFTGEDVFFLQAVASVLAGVVKRTDERWVTVQGVADMLQVTEETVRRWIRRGDLPAMNLGGPRAGYRMHPADLHKFIRERISTSP